jgi:biotin carboxyl carrier protein
MSVWGARRGLFALGAAVALLLATGTTAALSGGFAEPTVVSIPTSAAAAPTTSAAPPPTSAPAPAITTTVAPAPPVPAPPPPVPVRNIREQAWVPFATVGQLVLHHPSARVERIGFHESNHDGARPMEPLVSAVNPNVLESRERGTSATSAADIVADPGVEVRAPVTGSVKRGGTYVLYCDNRDSYLVIEPDGMPGFEVKVLHISGLRVSKGERVIAGQTVVAAHPTQLPFESQVDELGPQPAWPHVHVEVVDTSIPDKPNPGGSQPCP